MRIRRRWFAGLACLAAFGVAGAIVVHRREPAGSGGAGAPFGSAWRKGARLRYELAVESHLARPRLGPVLDLSLAGPLEVAVLERGPEIVLRVVFSGMVSQLHGGGDQGGSVQPEETGTALEAALRTPHYVRLSNQGALLGVVSGHGEMPFVKQFWTSVWAAVQFVTGEKKSEWTSEEDDPVGRYRALYRQVGDRRYEKQKPLYLQTRSPGVRYAPGAYRGEFALSEVGLFDRIVISEQMGAEAAGVMAPLESSVRVEFVLRGTAKDQLDVAAALAEAQTMSVEDERSDRPSSRAVDMQRIGRRKLSEILADLRTTANLARTSSLGREDEERRGRAYLALTSFLRVTPAAATEIKALILAEPTLARTLIAALRDGGTAEAQVAMQQLIETQGLDRTTRGLLARGLSHVKEPTPETVRTLTSLQSDPEIGTQATYGLGSNIHRLQATNPELAESTRKGLETRLAGATGDPERSIILTALGNAGQIESLDAVKPFTESANASVRVTSAQALRRVPGEAADETLAKLTSDTSVEVRYSALDAISERPVSDSLRPVVIRSALSESDFKTRLIATQTLAGWLNTSPDLAATLETVAGQDGSEDIRRVARFALDRRNRRP